MVGAILNSANFHESFFATHPSYHNVEGPKIGRPTNVDPVPCLVRTYVCIPCSRQFILCNCSGSGAAARRCAATCNAPLASRYNNHNLARQKNTWLLYVVCGGLVHAYVYGTYVHSMRMQNAATGSERECSCMIACTDKSLAEINLLACKPAKLEQYTLYCAYVLHSV